MRLKPIILPALAAIFFLNLSGDKLPNATLSDLNQKPVKLSELHQHGPLVLDFWATWCMPCIKAIPELEKLQQKYEDRGLQVVGINEDASRNQAKVKPFAAKLKVTFPILLDRDNAFMDKLKVQALPTTLLVAPDGEIIWRHTGFSPKTAKKLEAQIDAILQKVKADSSLQNGKGRERKTDN